MTASLTLALLLVAASPSGDVLATLRPEHPRLIAVDADLQRVKKLVADEPKAAAIYATLKKSADDLLKTPPVKRVLEQRSSATMLTTSRKCVDRVYTLATLYRMTGDRRYAQRGIREMIAAAEFSDWNARVFLDTAEMTYAVAIGYDWLFGAMSETDRRTVRQAIVEKGLREGEKVYREGKGWTKVRHNWNLVCNGGMAIGALAVAEDEPQLARYILQRVRESVPLALAEYAPDGGWPESPGYWSYATHYTVYMLASMESALGTDFGLAAAPGFARTGDFCMHVQGPTGLAFNYGDSSAKVGRGSAIYWLARKFDRPAYTWYAREQGGTPSALNLWWFDPRGSKPDDLPTAQWFRHTDVVTMRSKWHDPRAMFVGFRGGDNKANHSHLELGNFVLDAVGQRWVMALGAESYAMPGYFGRQRWTYYRAGTIGQNTLLIDGKNQDPKATAPITAFSSSPDRTHAVADLSAAYAESAGRVVRGVALLAGREVLVQDELESVSGREIAWQIHTPAKVKLQGDQATLTHGGETLTARILAPKGAKFDVEGVKLPPPQHSTSGVSKLTIRIASQKAPMRLAVLFTPGEQGETTRPALTPLATWAKTPAR